MKLSRVDKEAIELKNRMENLADEYSFESYIKAVLIMETGFENMSDVQELYNYFMSDKNSLLNERVEDKASEIRIKRRED